MSLSPYRELSIRSAAVRGERPCRLRGCAGLL